jgi:dihydropyrimidine dehydrogenase (NADP+)
MYAVLHADRMLSNGHIVAIELYKMEKGDDGEYRVDEDQFIRVKCDFVISAFGSELGSLAPACHPLTISRNGFAEVRPCWSLITVTRSSL